MGNVVKSTEVTAEGLAGCCGDSSAPAPGRPLAKNASLAAVEARPSPRGAERMIRDQALALKRKGLIPDSTGSIFQQANDCTDSAESRFTISAGICATRYGICSLGCLIPYSPFS